MFLQAHFIGSVAGPAALQQWAAVFFASFSSAWAIQHHVNVFNKIFITSKQLINWASICIKRSCCSLFCIFQVLNFSTPRQTVSCFSAWSKHISQETKALKKIILDFRHFLLKRDFKIFILSLLSSWF